jgi:hypothetical protein
MERRWRLFGNILLAGRQEGGNNWRQHRVRHQNKFPFDFFLFTVLYSFCGGRTAGTKFTITTKGLDEEFSAFSFILHPARTSRHALVCARRRGGPGVFGTKASGHGFSVEKMVVVGRGTSTGEGVQGFLVVLCHDSMDFTFVVGEGGESLAGGPRSRVVYRSQHLLSLRAVGVGHSKSGWLAGGRVIIIGKDIDALVACTMAPRKETVVHAPR